MKKFLVAALLTALLGFSALACGHKAPPHPPPDEPPKNQNK